MLARKGRQLQRTTTRLRTCGPCGSKEPHVVNMHDNLAHGHGRDRVTSVIRKEDESPSLLRGVSLAGPDTSFSCGHRNPRRQDGKEEATAARSNRAMQQVAAGPVPTVTRGRTRESASTPVTTTPRGGDRPRQADGAKAVARMRKHASRRGRKRGCPRLCVQENDRTRDPSSTAQGRFRKRE